jgi:hypothetical protein
MLLSGCIATPEKWDRFERQWYGMLRSWHLPLIHAKDLCKHSGIFKRFNWEERVQIAEAIDRAVFENIRCGFSTVLLPQDFAEYREHRALNSILDSDYGVSFRIALSFLHAHVSSIYEDPNPGIHVLVETGHENVGAASTIFDQYCREIGPDAPVRSVSTVQKQLCYGTQATDVRGYLILDEERHKIIGFQDITPDEANIQKYMQGRGLPWFRLPLTPEVLSDLRDNAILAKEKFRQCFAHCLSDRAPSEERP